jgi:hypothetical protein
MTSQPRQSTVLAVSLHANLRLIEEVLSVIAKDALPSAELLRADADHCEDLGVTGAALTLRFVADALVAALPGGHDER